MSQQKIPHYSPGLYAVRHIDNWDGQRDIRLSFAKLDESGVWTYSDTGAALLEYKGDKVLHAWPLEVAKTPQAEVVGVRLAWLADWVLDMEGTTQEGGVMDSQVKHLLDLHPSN